MTRQQNAEREMRMAAVANQWIPKRESEIRKTAGRTESYRVANAARLAAEDRQRRGLGEIRP